MEVTAGHCERSRDQRGHTATLPRIEPYQGGRLMVY